MAAPRGPTVAKARSAAAARDAPRALDFRSDTVTQPTDAMRRAMAEAPVGDDVYGEDPTVNELQDRVARLLGMEAALFVPTGTMGNQIAVWVHTRRRRAVLAEEHSHIAYYEGGAASLLSGAMVKTLPSRDGTFTPGQMAEHLDAPKDPHFADIGLVTAEDTHNYAGGRVWPLRALAAVRDAAHLKKVPLHIDGARVWNAAVALDATPARICKGADSVMVALSKGLSAPVGSLLAGSQEFVDEARFVRKWLGGGMRQAGHLAAAGLVALDGVGRLAEDHANARRLARGIADLPGCRVLGPVETNMVMVDVSETGKDAPSFIADARRLGVLIGARGTDRVVRFVTHRNVTAEDCKEALDRLQALR
jgi:threonine aldolase